MRLKLKEDQCFAEIFESIATEAGFTISVFANTMTSNDVSLKEGGQ